MITDEMIDKALAASNKTRRHLDPTGKQRMRAALEAVAADIGEAAKLEAYKRKEFYFLGNVLEFVQAARLKALKDAEARVLDLMDVTGSNNDEFANGRLTMAVACRDVLREMQAEVTP